MKIFPFNLIGLIVLMTISTSFKTSEKTVVKKDKLNVIVIMADDLDSRQLSCYGGRNINTRNIDALAAGGMKFNTMVASEAMCIPTRASLFTGLYPVRHGAYQNHKPVYNNLKSVGHYLGDLGYRVGLTGKNHMTTPHSVFPFQLIKGFEPNCVANTDDYFLDSIRNFITQKEPYCLFLMSINPHAPWTVGDPSEFEAEKLKLPAHWVDTKLTRNQFCKYLAEVRRLDNQVGEVMKLLKETGQDEKTIVIFLGEQGAQFPGAKWNLYEDGQKSAMIVKWPGVIKGKTQSDAIIQYEDVTPTLIDIAGGKAIDKLDGKSFKQVLSGKKNIHRAYAYGIHNNFPEGPAYPIRSIRDLKYKLILNLSADSSYYIKYMMNTDNKQLAWTTWINKAKSSEKAKILTDRISKRPAIEFYNLVDDPSELTNLAAQIKYKPLIAQYKRWLEGWMNKQGDKGAALDIPF